MSTECVDVMRPLKLLCVALLTIIGLTKAEETELKIFNNDRTKYLWIIGGGSLVLFYIMISIVRCFFLAKKSQKIHIDDPTQAQLKKSTIVDSEEPVDEHADEPSHDITERKPMIQT